MAEIKNLTPHAISLCDEAGIVVRSIPASGDVARLAVKTVAAGEVDGIKLSKTVFGEPVGLPEIDVIFPYCENCHSCNPINCHVGNGNVSEIRTYLIVSQLIKTALPFRRDLLVPAEVVRNSDGNIIGCRSLGI